MAGNMRGIPKNLLFIGNSFTSRNDLPGMLTLLAKACDISIQHRLIFAGGASLRAHWNAGKAVAAIQTRQFDHVVLQEQSTLPVKNSIRMHENVRLFAAEIKNAQAKTVLYMTWARQSAPQAQKAITAAYAGIAKELGAILVPAGKAWQAFLSKYDHPVLHDRDGSHPTLAGTYLAACVFLGVLFKVSPVGLDDQIQGLSSNEKLLLQKVAWQSCKSLNPNK